MCYTGNYSLHLNKISILNMLQCGRASSSDMIAIKSIPKQKLIKCCTLSFKKHIKLAQQCSRLPAGNSQCPSKPCTDRQWAYRHTLKPLYSTLMLCPYPLLLLSVSPSGSSHSFGSFEFQHGRPLMSRVNCYTTRRDC